MILGFPFSFGVLQDYYITHEPFKRHTKGVSAIGTTCSVSVAYHNDIPVDMITETPGSYHTVVLTFE